MFTIDNSKAKSTLQQHWILKETLIVHLIDGDQSSRSGVYDLRGRGESWWSSLRNGQTDEPSSGKLTNRGWVVESHCAQPGAQSLLIWDNLWPSGKAWNGAKVLSVQSLNNIWVISNLGRHLDLLNSWKSRKDAQDGDQMLRRSHKDNERRIHLVIQVFKWWKRVWKISDD